MAKFGHRFLPQANTDWKLRIAPERELNVIGYRDIGDLHDWGNKNRRSKGRHLQSWLIVNVLEIFSIGYNQEHSAHYAMPLEGMHGNIHAT